jgi:hypothetical protein
MCGVCCQNFLGEGVLRGLTTHLGHYLNLIAERLKHAQEDYESRETP